MLKRSPYRPRVLQREISVVEEHLDCGSNGGRAKVVPRCQHPHGLGKHEMRNPSPLGYESLCCRRLLGVIPCREPHQNVGVNGAHTVPPCIAVPLPSSPQASEASAASGTKLCAHPPRCSGPRDGRRSSRRLRPIPVPSLGQCQASAALQLVLRFAPEL